MRALVRSLAVALAIMVSPAWVASADDLTTSSPYMPTQLNDEPWWQVNISTDATLNRHHVLYRYFSAAQLKKLPGQYFRDILRANANISVRYGEWPHYQPGFLFFGGTIYHPAARTAPSEWHAWDWSTFYNELYHAWWDKVFTKSKAYQQDRAALLTAERQAHYRKAHPMNPRLAQEEAYSETIGTLILYLYPQFSPSSSNPNHIGYFSHDFYLYQIDKTVSPVSHGEQPGYTPKAENTYPNETEYKIIFRELTGMEPPQPAKD